ncbi:MAG: glycerophosphodiester phosphodiesterase [Clostridiales bacterium]|jgi:glycerophosphoryl diester phosphodiesterase|nr:glycerophosphodiester phosphodiesterase [Clostridiales bacterium]
MKKGYEDTSWLKSIPIAHRGLHSQGMPENSLDAYKMAIKSGYAIELDLRLTSDEKVVVFHDESTVRMTGAKYIIEKTDYETLSKLRLNSTNSKIPLFSEVLELVAGKVPLLIEIKNDRSPGVLEKSICDILKEYDGRFAIQSFNPWTLNYVKRLEPDYPRGQLSWIYDDNSLVWVFRLIGRSMVANAINKPLFISYRINDLPSKRIANLRKKGMIILGWTVRSKSDLNHAKKYCDNVIFENIKVMIPLQDL